MNIIILGKGNMGMPFATLASSSGHVVQAFGSEGAPSDVLGAADLVVLAMKYGEAIAFAEAPGIPKILEGKIVVDLTNPLAPDFMSLTVGHTTSAGEEIARRLPRAKVVKAFNTIFASVLAKHAQGEATRIPVFVAGDDAEAVESIVGLARTFAFEAIASGPLSNARYLESMTELMIQLGYGLGHGDKIGFSLLKTS